MKANRFRQVVAEGRVPVGHMIMEFGTRGIARLLASVDLDFVVFDMEHGGFDFERIADLLAWASGVPLTPIVRVPQPLYHFLARVMDAGAQGVMIPNVRTAEQARDIVDAVRYAPGGRRGGALGTANNDYVLPDACEYFARANAETVVMCQIESPEGLRNAGDIAAVDGVDVLWLGQCDLTLSMNIPLCFDDRRFTDALITVVDAARRHGKLACIQPGSPEQAEAWMKVGFDVISWATDIDVYRNALADGVSLIRKLESARTAQA